MKINKYIFKYVEHELFNYEDTKKELILYKNDIIESTQSTEVVVQSSLGDTTANKAISLVTSKYILQAERIIQAIEKSLDMLSDVHRELFRLRYIECLDYIEIPIELSISERSYYRLRRQLVTTVAQQLGLIKI